MRRRPGDHDDLLSGFDQPDRRATELRGFFASALGASLVAWELAFSFGAYDTIFYSRLFQIVVIALVLLLGALALRREIRVRPRMFVVLAMPVAWLVFRVLANIAGHRPWYRAADLVLTLLTVLTLPLLLWAVARILAPDYFALSSGRLRATAVVIVLVVSAAGYLVGRFNHQILICQDFLVAGDYQPPGCKNAPEPERWIDR